MEFWDRKTDDTRTADSLPTFFIFCEDEASEVVYIKVFETPSIKINLIGGQKGKMDNVVKAVTHCLAEELMTHVDGVPKLKAGDTHVWCVFDRDVEDESPKRPAGNTSFDLSIATAISSGIKVAWSNDAFELWVLLHFEDVDPEILQTAHRKFYYDRLTNIFADFPNPNQDLVKARSHPTFNYKKDLKQESNFRSIVRPELIPRTAKAIQRAINLAESHPFAAPSHQKAPCTLMHELIAELLKVGGKEV